MLNTIFILFINKIIKVKVIKNPIKKLKKSGKYN